MTDRTDGADRAAGIVKAERLDALSVAQSGIDRAREEAEAIKAAAMEEAAAIRQKAIEEGRAEVAQMFAAAAREIEDDLAAIEQRIADLVMECVRQVISPYNDAERIALMVNRALDDFDRRRPVSVVVAPDLADEVRRYVDALSVGDQVDVRGTPGIARGASLLETPWGVVELGVEAQLEALEAALAATAGTPS